MAWLQPWMWWAAPAILLPIIIHLLNRLRYKTVAIETGTLPTQSPARAPTEPMLKEKVVAESASLPKSEQEKAVAKLVLVFFQDKSRRAIPCLVLNVSDKTFVISAGPAGIVPDGTAHAVDRAFLELPGKPPMQVEFDPRSTKEFRVDRVKENLHAVKSCRRRKNRGVKSL